MPDFTEEDFQLWRDELSVSEFKALVTERDDAQEAAEEYWEGWVTEQEYGKYEVARLDAQCDRLREALREYGSHRAWCAKVRGHGVPDCDCGLDETLT